MRGIFKGKLNKVILSVIAVFFVLSNFYLFIFYSANEANAQQVVIDPTQAAIQIPWKGLEIARYSMEEILNDLKATFFKNVVANLSRNFAKSYSQFMVTGAKGGKPFWETNVWDSIKNQGDAAFEDWLTAAISNGTGLDLCKLDPKLTLNIALTLPNKRDKGGATGSSTTGKVKKEKTVLGSEAAEGCSFEDLKDKFSNDNPVWQDFIKIQATDIGPDFRETIDQLSRDISGNQNLRQNNAGVPNFTNPPSVLSDLNTKTNDLGTMRNELDSDVTIMIDKRGTKEQVTLSVGSYILAPEYIAEIKAAWIKKIGAGRSEANTKKAAFRGCYNKDIVTIRLDPCASLLKELGYPAPPGETWVKDNPDKAQQFVREVQSKLETTYNLYNSLANGYEGLYSFINSQIKPEMFESGGLYTYQKAKTQFEPQADPASATQQQVEAGTTKAKTTAEERKKTEISTTGGWKNSVETISGYIKTPADLLKAKSIESLAKGDSAGTFTKSIVADSLGIFLQELYNMYINQMLMALSNPKKQKSTNDGNTFNAKKQSIVTEEGVNLYFDQMDPAFASNLPDVDLLQEFQTTINAKKVNANIYNNVIDLNFAMAINQRMTISEAMTGGSPKLSPRLTFSWAEDLQSNTLHLSNIRKLRKARVVPLGLELAAQLIRDCNYRNILDENGDGTAEFANYSDISSATPGGYSFTNQPYSFQRMQNCLFTIPTINAGDSDDNKNSAITAARNTNINLMKKVINATLAEVVDGFDDRGIDGICGNYDSDSESPFCNLVDPNWVLKIPATKCLQDTKTETYGEIIQDNQSGLRYARCADFISCLMDDSKNNCANPLSEVPQYGVCVKEKNVWRLGGETCQPQYDSCRAYTMTDSKGKDSDVAFLKNTLDPSGCSPDVVGCKGYTRSYDTKKIYFNRNVETCEAEEEGCHEFITDQTTIDTLIADSTLPTVYDDNVLASRVYYKINPACEINPEGANCSNYMTKCEAWEVGCASYKPLNGEPAVSAVLQTEDQCAAECNGFSAYFRQPTSFEPASKVDYFVNNDTAKTCSAASVGCAEFTNLEKINTGVPVAEALEYYTSLRQCIKPGSGLNEKTFFTWQSISSGPQQVIKHLLQAAGDGAPQTIDDSGNCLGDVAVGDYCLKFYDVDGKTYYRDIRKTIIVSETGCYPLRKTDSNEATCTTTNGTWDNTNNYCTYNAYSPTAQEASKAGFGEMSQKCSAVENGCFNYLGASGNNVYMAFFDNFEGLTDFPEEWQADDNLSIIGESLSESGRSLRINTGAQAIRSAEINGGKYYVLQFLAKGTCTEPATSVSGTVAVTGFGSVNLDCNWGYYQLGPLKVDSNLSNANLVITNQTGVPIFIDNVSLIQYKANYYLIENSWQQVGCGVEDLNCSAYAGPNNQTYYIKQFSSLCGEDKIGCQYLLDTQNSLNPQVEDFSGVIVPSDNLTSYVVNKDFKCTIKAKGCESFIEPVISADSGIGYNNVILKNDPDAYAGARSILCPAEAEGCTELTNEAGYPEYYKINPLRVCQYSHNFISGLGRDIYGWYLATAEETTGCNTIDYNNSVGCVANGPAGNKGIWNSLNETCSISIDSSVLKKIACEANNGLWISDSEQCARKLTGVTEGNCAGANGIWIDSVCIADPFGIFKVSEDWYDSYTGACPLKSANCTGFQTVNQNNVTYGESYYMIDNEENINRVGCTSIGTDWNKGCVAFKNTVNNEVQTIKVDKDRDCAEWVDCLKKDNLGNCLKLANRVFTNINGVPKVENKRISVSSTFCNLLNPQECLRELESEGGLGFCQVLANGSSCASTGKYYDVVSGDNVRYSAAGEPQIINRKSYIQRFATAEEIWDKGDYSGYTIPDRPPMEMELRSAYGFSVYARDSLAANDTRFTQPVCKIFPAEDSPLPYEILRKTGYSKIQNVYSMSVSAEEIADGCSYTTVESQGITTYFPFGYLDAVFGDTDPKICTQLSAVNGKVCTGRAKNNPDCRTSSKDTVESMTQEEADLTTLAQLTPEEKNQLANAYGKCSGVENIKTNSGMKGRCLEMDYLNPLYGNVTPGTYACLSYFPFQYDECTLLSDDEGKCNKMPNCTWIGGLDTMTTVVGGGTVGTIIGGSQVASGTGLCVGDVCRYLKNVDACSNDNRCLWDGAKQSCLFKICSLSNANSLGSCRNLADYCQFYDGNCVEDICAKPYASLQGHWDSHPEDKADKCANSAKPSGSGSLTPGNGAYCAWQMRGPLDKGRYEFGCQLQCDRKYPTDAGATHKAACDADKYCKWGSPACQDVCDDKDPLDCESNTDCRWDEEESKCLDQCIIYEKTKIYSSCNESNGCTYTATCTDATNVCTGKTDANACTSVPYANITRIVDGTPQTVSAPVCTWTPSTGTCAKTTEFQCATKSATTTPSCSATPGCTVTGQSCAKANICVNTSLDAESCAAKNTAGHADCIWGGGKCVTALNLRGCDRHAYSAAVIGGTFGQACRDDENCRWMYYDWSNYNFCFPKDCTKFTSSALCTSNSDCAWVNNKCIRNGGPDYNSILECHMCVPGLNKNTCSGGSCN